MRASQLNVMCNTRTGDGLTLISPSLTLKVRVITFFSHGNISPYTLSNSPSILPWDRPSRRWLTFFRGNGPGRPSTISTTANETIEPLLTRLGDRGHLSLQRVLCERQREFP